MDERREQLQRRFLLQQARKRDREQRRAQRRRAEGVKQRRKERDRKPEPGSGGRRTMPFARAVRRRETEATREESKARGARAPPEVLGLPTRRARRAACCVRRVCSLVVRAPPARGGGPAGVARAE